jgi:hypothetical protein
MMGCPVPAYERDDEMCIPEFGWEGQVSLDRSRYLYTIYMCAHRGGPGFEPGSGQVGFVVDKVALG